MTGITIFAFVIGFTIGVLAMAFFKGAAMSEANAKLFSQQDLINQMKDAMLLVFAVPDDQDRVRHVLGEWVGERGKFANQ